MANVMMFSPPPPPYVDDQIVNCCGAESFVVPTAPLRAMGVKIKIVVEEIQRLTTMGTPSQILEENLVVPQERGGWLLFRRSDFHRDAIASLVSSLVSTIHNILPHHQSRVSSQVSDSVIHALSTAPLTLLNAYACLQIKSLVRLHTTRRLRADRNHLIEARFLLQELAPPPSVQEQRRPQSVNITTLPPRARFGPLPASLASIKNMPSKLYSSDGAGDCCPVCLEEFSPGCRVSEMPCSHLFHKSCIVPWLLLNSTCPSCRFKMPTDQTDL